MSMWWRARAGDVVLSEAPSRDQLDVSTLADTLLTGGVFERITVQCKTYDSPWYSVETFTLDADRHVQQQYHLPFREPEPVEPPPVKKVRRTKLFWMTPEQRREHLRAQRRKHTRLTYQRRRAPLPDGPAPIPRGRFGHPETDEPTTHPAPAGMANDQFNWILRGLYQQQWEDVLERRYHPTEIVPTDWRLSQARWSRQRSLGHPPKHVWRPNSKQKESA